MISFILSMVSFLFILSLPAIIVFGVLFAIPMLYADKASEGMLDDLSSNPTDYTE